MQDGTYERFSYVVNREYSRVFQDIQGEDIPFGLPKVQIPIDTLGYFPTCSDSR